MAIPSQYQNNTPAIDNGNLSPLQIAAAYYMDQGQQIPFFINHEFLRQLTVFASSGVVNPSQVPYVQSGLAVVVKNDDVYVQRLAENCGPNEFARYELVYIGKKYDILPDSWTFGGTLVRGGSAATGGGGPWGTGGLTSPDPTPNNGVDRQPDIVSNTSAVYGATASTATTGIA